MGPGGRTEKGREYPWAYCGFFRGVVLCSLVFGAGVMNRH